MPTPKLSRELAQQAVDAVNKSGGNKSAASELLGIPEGTIQGRLRAARQFYNLTPAGPAPVQPVPDPGTPAPIPGTPARDLRAEVLKVLQRHDDLAISAIAERLRVTPGAVYDAVTTLAADGLNVFWHGPRGDVISIERTPLPVAPTDELHVYPSDDEGRYRFGVVSDNHLGSKYARLDVLAELYDWFAAEGITRVYNAGNWIDGEARFNRMDLLVHGMTAQIEHFCAEYPQRPGIVTYYIAGDDHEVWYARDALVDIGRVVEQEARDRGRMDLRYLGYMEAWIRLRHFAGAEAAMWVVHPGGGSAYATSYAPQKMIESLQGGEKPAVAIVGHFHKMELLNYRNTWIYQAGTTMDQSPFMRKKRLDAHVGGGIIELRQDDRGAITDCIPHMKRYFDRGYYQHQYDPARPVVRP